MKKVLNSIIMFVLIASGAFASEFDISTVQGVPAPVAPSVKRKAMRMENIKAEQSNGSYLNHVATPAPQKSINQFLFDQQIAGEMNTRYEAISKNYEFRRQYHLTSRQDDLAVENANKDLIDWTMNKMVQYHTENSLKQAPQDTAGGKAAAGAVSTFHAIQNTNVQLGEDTKAKFKYDIPHGSLLFGLNSPIVDTSVNYRTRTLFRSARPAEPLTLGMDKAVKPIAASGQARYAVTNQTLNYGVNKHLFGPFSAGVDQSKHLRDASRDETVGRINYGTNF